MIERELNQAETKALYDKICIEHIMSDDIEHEKDCTSVYYSVDGKNYRLIYDREVDWFLDIAYELSDI